jgi:hypothetical protein
LSRSVTSSMKLQALPPAPVMTRPDTRPIATRPGRARTLGSQ